MLTIVESDMEGRSKNVGFFKPTIRSYIRRIKGDQNLTLSQGLKTTDEERCIKIIDGNSCENILSSKIAEDLKCSKPNETKPINNNNKRKSFNTFEVTSKSIKPIDKKIFKKNETSKKSHNEAMKLNNYCNASDSDDDSLNLVPSPNNEMKKSINKKLTPINSSNSGDNSNLFTSKSINSSKSNPKVLINSKENSSLSDCSLTLNQQKKIKLNETEVGISDKELDISDCIFDQTKVESKKIKSLSKACLLELQSSFINDSKNLTFTIPSYEKSEEENLSYLCSSFSQNNKTGVKRKSDDLSPNDSSSCDEYGPSPESKRSLSIHSLKVC